MTDAAVQARRRSMDEIFRELELIAFEGEGADKFRALKMLKDQERGDITLPEPLTSGDIIDRLARMMRPAGMDLAQQAFHRAFPKSTRNIADAPKITVSDLPEWAEDKVRKIKTIKQFNKAFPKARVPGYPKGYPASGGLVVQQEFLQNMARRMIRDDLQAEANANAERLKESVAAIDEGTDAPLRPDE